MLTVVHLARNLAVVQIVGMSDTLITLVIDILMILNIYYRQVFWQIYYRPHPRSQIIHISGPASRGQVKIFAQENQSRFTRMSLE